MNKLVKRVASGLVAAAVCVTAMASQVFAITTSNLARHNSIGIENQAPMSTVYTEGLVNTQVSVNHFSGNVTIQTRAHMGTHLELDVTYNSLGKGSEELGEHFTTNFNRTLSLMEDGAYEYRDVTDTPFHFEPQDRDYGRDELNRDLYFDQEGYPYKLQYALQRLEYMNADGKLAHMVERHMGTQYINTDVYYQQDGKLQSVDNEVYQYGFSYNADGRMNRARYSSIEVPTAYPETLYFEYNQDSQKLAAVHTGSDGVSYTYDENNQFVTGVGNVQITYDDAGRCTKLVETDDSGAAIREISYIYGSYQTVIMEDGNLTLENFNLDGTLIQK